MSGDITTQELIDLTHELDRMSDMLIANAPPGHVDFLSKKGAASWAANLSNRVRAWIRDRAKGGQDVD